MLNDKIRLYFYDFLRLMLSGGLQFDIPCEFEKSKWFDSGG